MARVWEEGGSGRAEVNRLSTLTTNSHLGKFDFALGKVEARVRLVDAPVDGNDASWSKQALKRTEKNNSNKTNERGTCFSSP